MRTLQRGFDALNRGDLGSVRQTVTADVEWEATRTSPRMKGVYRGAAGLNEWMHLFRSVGPPFDLSLDDVAGETEHALVVEERLRGRDRESGVEAEMRVFAVYWFDAGRIRRRRAFASRTEALQAAGLRQ